MEMDVDRDIPPRKIFSAIQVFPSVNFVNTSLRLWLPEYREVINFVATNVFA